MVTNRRKVITFTYLDIKKKALECAVFYFRLNLLAKRLTSFHSLLKSPTSYAGDVDLLLYSLVILCTIFEVLDH